jgi:hypothetical protein
MTVNGNASTWQVVDVVADEEVVANEMDNEIYAVNEMDVVIEMGESAYN